MQSTSSIPQNPSIPQGDDDVRSIAIHADKLPPEVVIEQFMEGADRSATTLKVFSVRHDADAKKRLGKRLHDLTSALRTLRFAVEALQSGYRFDDESADSKIASMERAISNLEKEAPLLEKLLLA